MYYSKTVSILKMATFAASRFMRYHDLSRSTRKGVTHGRQT